MTTKDELTKMHKESARKIGLANKGRKQSPEHKEARKEARTANVIMKVAVYDRLKQDLLASKGDLSKVTYLDEFMDKFLAEARKDPCSKAGVILAQCIFKDNLLDLIDKDASNAMAKDHDFQMYRLLKQFYDQQRAMLMDLNQYRKMIAITSRRVGKTTTAAGAIVAEALTPGSPVTYVNLTFSNAIDQIWAKVLSYSESVGLEIERASQPEGSIEWTNGSKLNVCGNNSNKEADKLRGFSTRCAIIDEIGHQRNVDYLLNEVLLPQMVDYPDSTLMLIGTPSREPHHFSTKIFQEDATYKKYHWTMMDNPYITGAKEFIEDLCRTKGITLDSPFIRREYFGEFAADTDALVFRDYATYDTLPDDFIPTNIVIGADYGYQDSNGIVTLVYDKKTKKAFVTNESKFNRAPVTQIMDTIEEHYHKAVEIADKYHLKHDNIAIFADTNEESITRDLQVVRHLPAFNCYKYDRDYAIEVLAEQCRIGGIKIKTDGPLANEFQTILYCRDKDDNIVSKIDDSVFHPDIMMALLYASRQMFYDFGLEVEYKAPAATDGYVKDSAGNITVGAANAPAQFKDLGIVG